MAKSYLVQRTVNASPERIWTLSLIESFAQLADGLKIASQAARN